MQPMTGYCSSRIDMITNNIFCLHGNRIQEKMLRKQEKYRRRGEKHEEKLKRREDKLKRRHEFLREIPSKKEKLEFPLLAVPFE